MGPSDSNQETVLIDLPFTFLFPKFVYSREPFKLCRFLFFQEEDRPCCPYQNSSYIRTTFHLPGFPDIICKYGWQLHGGSLSTSRFSGYDFLYGHTSNNWTLQQGTMERISHTPNQMAIGSTTWSGRAPVFGSKDFIVYNSLASVVSWRVPNFLYGSSWMAFGTRQMASSHTDNFPLA